MSIDKIRKLLKNSPNGIITAKLVTENNIHRGYLNKMVENGEIIKVGTGLYLKSDLWEDELYLLQQKLNKGIFSHETALFLHGLTDRTPSKFTMTFPHGYNNQNLSNYNINVKHVIQNRYSIGIIKIKTPCNNLIYTYDIERTLCDIVKGKGSDIQIINESMRRYVQMKNKDVNKLMKYAEILNVKNKIQRYMEVLL